MPPAKATLASKAAQRPCNSLFTLGAENFRYGDFVSVRCDEGLPFIAFICDKSEKPIPLAGDVKLQWLYRFAPLISFDANNIAKVLVQRSQTF